MHPYIPYNIAVLRGPNDEHRHHCLQRSGESSETTALCKNGHLVRHIIAS